MWRRQVRRVDALAPGRFQTGGEGGAVLPLEVGALHFHAAGKRLHVARRVDPHQGMPKGRHVAE